MATVARNNFKFERQRVPYGPDTDRRFLPVGGETLGELDEFGIMEQQRAIITILEFRRANLLRVELQQCVAVALSSAIAREVIARGCAAWCHGQIPRNCRRP